MTSSNEPQSPEESSPRSRRPLLMAAAAVVVALLGWAIYQSGNEPEPARSVPTIAPSVSGKIAEAPAPAADAPPAGQTPATTAEPEPAPSPAATTEPASRLPHGPAPAPKPAAALAPARTAKEPAANPAPATKATAARPEPAPAAPARSVVMKQETPPPVAAAPAEAQPAGTSKGYRVQLGLFSNLGNATALIQRLKAADIPVRSETRVSVGPFQTRAEAEEAMQKLKDMGLSPMLAANGG
ncbi:SPOR domain-containing protein [Laribacter hongkongensis]|uniref:SPOR domain-containing protein n=1 Tax=Laribacter hongkongensis TaxID=168471 RepID=UPI001EFE8AD4|nr:SPOR domain-containing protein [Laribacter hongkongensis]MCG9052336.1 SPOR domain-containing protein [Laribacter hongkongensis]